MRPSDMSARVSAACAIASRLRDREGSAGAELDDPRADPQPLGAGGWVAQRELYSLIIGGLDETIRERLRTLGPKALDGLAGMSPWEFT